MTIRDNLEFVARMYNMTDKVQVVNQALVDLGLIERERGTKENLLAMPEWAQSIGNSLPLTYYNRLVRGIFLKGNGFPELWPNIWPLAIFAILLMTIAVVFYRRTLD